MPQIHPYVFNEPIKVEDLICLVADALSVESKFIFFGEESGKHFNLKSVFAEDRSLYVFLIDCYRVKILGKEVKFINAENIFTVADLKIVMENMDPQRLPIEHLLIMTEKFSTIDCKFHKVSLLDHEAIKDAIEHGTKFDIMYKTSPGEGKMEVVTHSIMNNLDFTFNAYSAKNSTALTIEKYLDLIVDELSEISRSKDAIAP